MSLALASSSPVLGLDRFCPRKGCPWPRTFFVSLALASSLVSSTPPLMPIIGLNSSSSKTNGTRGKKLSNLEASGHALSALKK